MKWETLLYRRMLKQAEPEDYVTFAILAMQQGCEQEEVVQLACLDFIQPLNAFEVEEAFLHVVEATIFPVLTREEVVKGYIKDQLEQLKRKYNYSQFQRVSQCLREENHLDELAKEWYRLDEEIEEMEVGDNQRGCTSSEIAQIAKRQIEKIWQQFFGVRDFEKLTGKIIHQMQCEENTLVLFIEQWQLKVRAAWHLTTANEWVLGNEDEEAFERCKQAIENEMITHIYVAPKGRTAMFTIGPYEWHLFQVTQEPAWTLQQSQ